MRQVLVTLLSAAIASSAVAQDDPFLFESCWRIAPDGAVVIWPDARLGPRMERSLEFTGLFPPLVRVAGNPETLLDCVAGLGWPTLVAVALSASDLVSATDAEHHFRKLRLGHDSCLLAPRVATSPEDFARGSPEPILRRAGLDRILALRMAASRNCDWLQRALEMALDDPDPFLRAEARRGLDRLAGKARASDPWMPDEIPAGCAVYAFIDWRRIPETGCLVRVFNVECERQARKLLDSVSAVAPEDFAGAQWKLDCRAELPYELARQFGNAMLTRAWVAGSWGAEPNGVAQVEGLIEIDQIRAALRGLGFPLREEAAAAVVDVAGMSIRCSASAAEARAGMLRTSRAPPASPELLEELKEAGLGGSDAVWIYVPDASVLPLLTSIGIKRLTLRVSFVDGIIARAEAVCRDEVDAARVAETLREQQARIAAAVLRGADAAAPDIEHLPDGSVGVSVALASPEAAAGLASLVRSIEVDVRGERVALRFHDPQRSVVGLFALVVAGCPSSIRLTANVTDR